MARLIAITGSASGMGRAAAAAARAAGDHVIGIDRAGADINVDLSTSEGRQSALTAMSALTDHLDSIITFAGLSGLTDRPGGVVTAVNYFGTVEILEGLRPLLAKGTNPAALAISSNSITTSPLVAPNVVEACLAGDEARAIDLSNAVPSVSAYPASKLAVAYWVRRKATQPEWIGAGINLNALAPGATHTAMTDEVSNDPVLGKQMKKFPVPLGRSATPEELAGTALFLVSPIARAFVGSVVFCDAGTDALLRTEDWPAAWKL